MFRSPLIGASPQHRQLVERLTKVAATDAEILISGPSGVGKELYACFAHEQSLRAKAAFVAVNCGALSADLLENELFGHVGGAFTGARPRTEGLVAAAEGGTIFLDEVDSLNFICQVKLLRFLQEKEYRRLGETRVRRANIRIIAATNTDLLCAVRQGTFREDLFFRLRVVPIEVPPLRDRREDISVLLEEFKVRFAAAYHLPEIKFSGAALDKLDSYAWPGNIRELENCVNYLTCWQLNRPILPADLPLLDVEQYASANGNGNGEAHSNGDWPVRKVTALKLPYNDAKRGLVDDFEREYLVSALQRSGGNIAKAARESQKPRRVFFEMMRKHGIKASDYISKVSVPLGM